MKDVQMFTYVFLHLEDWNSSQLPKEYFNLLSFVEKKSIILFNSELEKVSLSWKFYSLSGKKNLSNSLSHRPIYS